MNAHVRPSTLEASTLKTLSIVLAIAAAVGLALSTGGFSAIDADRGVVVSVVEDEEAYLSYDVTSHTTTANNTTTMTAEAEYRNQFTDELDLDVDVYVDHSHSKNEHIELPEGTEKSVKIEKECSPGATLDFRFEADGHSAGTSVSMKRSHTETC